MALFPPKNPAPAPAPIPMPAAARPTTLSAEDIARARNIGSQIRGRFAQTLVGQDNLRESLIIWLVTNGISYSELPVVSPEPVDWVKKGSSFLAAKFLGKKYERSF